jgi:peptidoglycan hydrolase CwlO-like protein
MPERQTIGPTGREGHYMGFGSHVKRMMRVVAVASATALLAAVPSLAAPSTPATTGSAITVSTDAATQKFRDELAQKQERIDEFNAQLDALDRELELASEQYNASVDRLAEMKARVTTVESDLSNAKSAYSQQSAILDERADSIYRDGSFAALEMLLNAKSVSDLMSRVKFLNTIGIRDAEIAASLEGQRGLLEQQASELRNTKAVAESLEFELKARQIEVMMRIQDREKIVAEAESDLREFLETEAARRQIEEAGILSEILSGASAQGIVVEPGSPVETALAYHGIPYLWGGELPSGFDCSGLMLYVFRQHGVTLPHYSGSQFQLGEKVAVTDLQPGDAVFFGSPIHHVGMYLGGGYYLHAPRTGDFVKISKLADRNDYAGARRYAWTTRTGSPTGAQSSVSKALSNVAR